MFSCFMAGGGIKGGQVIGSSDEDGALLRRTAGQGAPTFTRRSAMPLGIDPNKEVMTPLQRPMKLVDNGKPIRELF